MVIECVKCIENWCKVGGIGEKFIGQGKVDSILECILERVLVSNT